MLTCGPSVFLDVWMDSHAVQLGSTRRCCGILNADCCTQSIDLGVKNEPTLPGWLFAISCFTSLHLFLDGVPVTELLEPWSLPHLPHYLHEVHHHEWRRSWDAAGVGVDFGSGPACVVHLLANIILRVSLKVQVLNELQDMCLGAATY